MTNGGESGGGGSVRSLRMLFETGEPQRENASPSKPAPKPKPGTVKAPADGSPVKQEAERPEAKPKPGVRPKPPAGINPGPVPIPSPASENAQKHAPEEPAGPAEKKTNAEAAPKGSTGSSPPREGPPPSVPKRTDTQTIRSDLPAEKPPAIPRRPPATTPAAPAPTQARQDSSPGAPAPEPSATTNTNLLDDTPLNEPPKAIPEPKHTQAPERPPTERRPAPQPPSAHPAAPPARYNACFEAVCTRIANGEPKVTPATVSFVWARSKLPSAELAEIWDTVSNADPSCTGLDRAQFTCALALIDAKLDLAQTEKAPQAPQGSQAPPLPRRPAP